MPEIPANAKKPADHKAKDDGPKDIVATVAGREWTVPAGALDDFELLDDLNALEQREDGTRLPSILRRLLGDQWRPAMDAIRDKETGRVSVEAGGEFVSTLLGALNPNS